MNNSFITPIIKVTDYCNYNCQFCYYAQKKKQLTNRIMPISFAKDIISSVVDINISKENYVNHIIFHGGEPLLAGLPYYEELLAFEKKLKKHFPSISFENSIETNGYLLDDEWIKFFRDNDFGVGISIDGPTEMNYHKRSFDDSASEIKVLSNIKRMNELRAPFGVMSVITDKHLDFAHELYDFYINNNIHNVGFCYCFNHDTKDSVNPEKLVLFLEQFFDLFYYGNYQLRVREFEECIKRILGKQNNLCLFCNRNRCGNYPTIDSDGNVFFCDFGTEKDKAIGNVIEDSLIAIIDSDRWTREAENARAMISQKCLRCKDNEICGKICYRSDIKSNDSETRNYFCKVYPKIMRYIEAKIQ